MKCLIVIPAFNEESSLGQVLDGLLAMELETGILVVDDGSSDGTAELAKTYPIHVVSHPCNLGYGAALQTGFKFASYLGYSHVIQFDADGQHSPKDIRVLMDALLDTDADVVIGSRFLGPNGFHPELSKRLAIGLFRSVIWLFTRMWITDPTSGLRGVARPVFLYYSVANRYPPDYPDADMVIHMLLHGWSLKEVPVRHKQREQGVSMHSGIKPFIYMLKVLMSILSVVLGYYLAREETSSE